MFNNISRNKRKKVILIFDNKLTTARNYLLQRSYSNLVLCFFVEMKTKIFIDDNH